MSLATRIAALLVSLFGILGCAAVNEQWFFVPMASIQELELHRQLIRVFASNKPPSLGYENKEFVVLGHRITEGNEVVIAFRKFDSGQPFLVDAAQFLKVTVLVPQSLFKSGEEIVFPDVEKKGVIAYYSEGSSSFPGAGGCFGYATKGMIQVESVSETEAKFRLNLQFKLSSPLGSRSGCADKAIQGLFNGEKIPLSRLSAWQGVPGKSIYDETLNMK